VIKSAVYVFGLVVCFMVVCASYTVAVAGDDFDFEKFQNSLKNIKKTDMKYSNIVINRIAISNNSEIDKEDKPKEFTATTEAALSGILEESNLFDSVSIGKVPSNAKSSLVVKAELTEFRKVSTRKRMLLGWMAGHSNMELKASLIDAETGNVIVETTVGDSAMVEDSGVARNVGEKLAELVVKHSTIKK